MLIDISERKQAEAHQRMLLDELNHRVKNNTQMLHALLRARSARRRIRKRRQCLPTQVSGWPRCRPLSSSCTSTATRAASASASFCMRCVRRQAFGLAKLGLPSIFATAHGAPRIRARAAQATPLGWLQKPYSTEALIALVNAALARDR